MSKKKKILFLIQLPPPVHGASLRNKFLLESRLLNLNFNISLLEIKFANDVHDIGKLSFKKIIKTIYLAIRLLQQLLKNPDLVYFNFAVKEPAFYRDALLLLIIRLFKVKHALHIRTQGVSVASSNNKLKRLLYKYCFKKSETICLSEALSNDIKNVCNSSIHIMNNGIKDLAESYLKTKIEISNNTIKILFLSNLMRTKGIFDLLEAAKNLRFNNKEFNIQIVGKEYDIKEEEIKNKIEEFDLKEYVSILGPLYNNDKHEAFLNADIFVLPTYDEAFPGVVLEAMQFQLPVVSTNEGAIPEIVEDRETGLIIEKRNIEHLTEALSLLIDNKNLRKKMGQAGRVKFLNNYTSSKFEENMCTLFNRILT